MPDVSIIVVNYRTPEMTAQSVAAARAAARGLETEAIVVDNGAVDVDSLRGALPDATVVASPDNRGYAAGVNQGIARSSGRMLLLLNSDAFPQGDAISVLARELDAHPRVGIVAPRLVHDDGALQVNAFRRFPDLLTLFFDFCAPLHPLHGTRFHPHALPRQRFSGPAGPAAHVMGAAMLVRAEAARQAGPLDERFFLYLEETEWQRRITAAGWDVWLQPAATVVHLERASSGATVVSPHYLRSTALYFPRPRAARAVMRLGAAISVAAAAVAARLRPADPRFPKLAAAYREVLERTASARS